MSTLTLATKLYIPPRRPNVVVRPRLIERLNEDQRVGRKLTLISAPAGFGKTTLVSAWVHTNVSGDKRETGEEQRPDKTSTAPRFAWLSLDEGDNDPVRFLTYLVAALQTIAPTVGEQAVGMLRSPRSPPTESILTVLLNDITTILEETVLILDDYHVIDIQLINQAVTFLVEHLPPQLHLVIATREDPQLPLARLRARGQLTELRAADLRFTRAEATKFLNRTMSLDLSNKDVAALEARTEGWIAGLHLAAIALRGTLLTPGDKEASDFIKSFTGSHRFILDYLIEEVLEQQSESVRAFLLQTAILDRLTGPLCNAVTGQDNGQATLKRLERANLFLVPLDNERRWYRYHHLFADLLRQRLPQSTIPTPGVAELHRRASVWYEENGMELAAFQHAVAAPDIDRAARLVEGGKPGGLPLQFRGAVTPVLNWLASLPTTVLDARPSLWVMYASALSMTGQLSGVEEKLQAAEAALQEIEPDDKTRNLIGHIAAIRALLAATQHQPEAIITQSRRALEYLHPDNLAVRTATTWKLGIAYHLQGDRAAAGEAYAEAISSSQASGNTIINIAATIGLGQVQESENQLYQAAETYQRALELAGEPLQPNAGEAHLGLARIHYEWNDLEAAQEHGQQSFQLAQQMESMHTFADCGVFLARLKLAQGDVMSATAMLEKAEQFVRQHEFTRLAPKIAAAQVRILLRQGNIAAAAQVAEAYELPHSQARVHLAQGDPAAALAALEPWRRRAEARHWADEQLKVKILQAMALQAEGKKDEAVRLSGKALELAAPGGFIRTFVDEGLPMAHLLFEAKNRGIAPDYLNNLLSAFPTSSNPSDAPSTIESSKAEMVEPLTSRELEVLRLIAQGLSNREIGERLFIAVSTVKGHNQNIYSKLQVHRRTEAVARARELELLQP